MGSGRQRFGERGGGVVEEGEDSVLRLCGEALRFVDLVDVSVPRFDRFLGARSSEGARIGL